MLPAILWKRCCTELPNTSGTQGCVLWVTMKAVLTWTGKLFLLHLPGVLFVRRYGSGGRGGGITANLFIRFHYRQGRGNTARVYILSWCGVSSKLDVVAAKNVQDGVLCKLHSWFLLNKTFPRHLASKCCISQDTALVLILPALKWVLVLVSKTRIVFHLSWSVTRQFFFELFCSSAVQDLMWKAATHFLLALLLFIYHNVVMLA